MPSKYNLPPELDISPDEDLTKDRIDEAFNYLVQKILILDSFKPEYQSQIDTLRNIGLQRLNEALLPIYESLINVSQIGVIFSASSQSVVKNGLGIKSFVLSQEDRVRYAATSYLGMQSLANPEIAMFGELQSYDRDTGVLTIACSQFVGPEADFSAPWKISAAATTNWLLTPGQIGAYTKEQVDSLVSSVINSLSAFAPKASPSFSGKPLAPTASPDSNDTQISTTAFVQDATKNRVRYDIGQTLNDTQKTRARSNIGAQSDLGYQPVAMGGAPGMSDGHFVRIGLSDKGLSAHVDATSFGAIWTDLSCPANLNGNGYQKLASGLIVQWGYIDIAPDQTVVFPTTFPNRVLYIGGTVIWGNAGNETWTFNYDQDSLSGFRAHIRHIVDNSVRTESYNTLFKYIAFGC